MVNPVLFHQDIYIPYCSVPVPTKKNPITAPYNFTSIFSLYKNRYLLELEASSGLRCWQPAPDRVLWLVSALEIHMNKCPLDLWQFLDPLLQRLPNGVSLS